MRRAASSFALALSVWFLGMLAGCAAPGDPTARHPIVPTPITDLAARQSGSAVVLTFSLPIRSTDREDLAEAPSIEIYRAALLPGIPLGRKTPLRLVDAIPSGRVDSYVKAGRVEFRDPLSPDDLAHATGSALAYVVRTREVKARASGDSNLFTVHVYSPPGTPDDLRANVMETAIALSWTESVASPGASSMTYRVYRAETESEEQAVPTDLSQAKLKSPLELAGSSSSPDFHDENFEFGKTYVYTVRSVAQFGADSVESSDSAPVIVTPRDIFPPSAPAGPVIVIISATPQAPAYVELSWGISPEVDFAGYNVYRSDQENTPGIRMNRELLLSPTFRDISALPSGRYFYRVSAVDRSGNESPKSPAVQAVVP